MCVAAMRVRGGGCGASKQPAANAPPPIIQDLDSGPGGAPPPAPAAAEAPVTAAAPETLAAAVAGGAQATATPEQMAAAEPLAAAAEAARAGDRLDDDEKHWKKYGGAELEPLLEADAGLGGSPVALVDARFLIDLAASGGRLLRRQDLPAAAFIPLARLRKMQNGPMRVLCVSYPWLQPDHPDPHGCTLGLLAKALALCLTQQRGTHAVFLDFCSLHQKDASGGRDEAAAALFGKALGSLSSIYSHPSTYILKVTKLPEGYPRGYTFPAGVHANQADYYERGWCFCESSMGNLVKDNMKVLDLGKFTGYYKNYVGLERECKAGRSAPLTPAAFAALLETKAFTSKKADLATVNDLYASAYAQRIGGAEIFVYNDLGWGDEDARVLCGALRDAKELKALGLDNNQIGDEGAAALAACLREGGAPKLCIILLDNNQIGDEGAAALAACLREGGAPKLVKLFLNDNQIGAEGAAALAACLREGGAPKLEMLNLRRTQIGDEGAAALRAAAAPREGLAVRV